MRLPQQIEVGLEARLVGRPDLAQRAEAENAVQRGPAGAPLAQLRRRDRAGRTQRADTTGKDEVPVAFDCFEGTAPISAAVDGQKLPVFPVETGI